MGILSAMSNSVGGIAAQSFALENISGNIANSQTTAYKRTDTSFADLVQSDTNNIRRMTAGNVTASSRSTIGIDGDIDDSDVETHMAINGEGFFRVSGDAVNTNALYTRRGDFEVDAEGYLVNGSGYYLMGYAEPYTDGDVRNLEPIMINEDSINAEPTENVTYSLNLPTEPQTTFAQENTDATITNPDIWADDTGGGDAARTHSAAVVAAGYVTADDEEEFLANSVSGGSVTAYDAQGTAVNLQLRWAKFGDNEWGLYYKGNDGTTTDAVWTQIPGNGTGTVLTSTAFTFDDSGQLTSDMDTELDLTGVTINGTTLSDITLDLSATQFAESDGQATVQKLTQDGSPVGYYESMSITDAGKVVYEYSNGKTEEKWDIPLVTFSGASALKPEDGGAYSQTMDSGAPSEFDGSISGSALESSNVDISTEFTKLIVTQQAFSANSKVITTADQMMSDIMNIIR